MSRRILGIALLVAIGCSPSKPEATVRQVTLAELEQETADLAYFNFVGMDDDFDYYTTPDGREFKLPAAESEMRKRMLPGMPIPMKPGDGMALFVKLRNGKWVQPDPDALPVGPGGW